MAIPIEINLNKKRFIVLAVIASLFVVAGIWLVTNTPTTSIVTSNPKFIKFVGVVSAAVFGFVLVWTLRKVFDDRPAMIITDEAVIDNSSGVSAGEVLWKDITAVKVVKVYHQKFLMLIVRNPQEYIDRQTKSMKKRAMDLNFKTYGSPISIASSNLDYKFEALKSELERRVEKRRL